MPHPAGSPVNMRGLSSPMPAGGVALGGGFRMPSPPGMVSPYQGSSSPIEPRGSPYGGYVLPHQIGAGFLPYPHGVPTPAPGRSPPMLHGGPSSYSGSNSERNMNSPVASSVFGPVGGGLHPQSFQSLLGGRQESADSEPPARQIGRLGGRSPILPGNMHSPPPMLRQSEVPRGGTFLGNNAELDRESLPPMEESPRLRSRTPSPGWG